MLKSSAVIVAAAFGILVTGVPIAHAVVIDSTDIAIDVPDQWFRSLRAARLEVTGLNHGFVRALLSRAWGQGEEAWSASAVRSDPIGRRLTTSMASAAHRRVPSMSPRSMHSCARLL